MFDFPKATAIVCHDTGAANILIALLLESGKKDWLAYMLGPALKLWKMAFPENTICGSIEEAVGKADLVITGTGWESDVEYNALKVAKILKVKSIAVIDHWVNYKERFVRHGNEIWPDEFWVTDEYAKKIASNFFPIKSIIQIPNYYVEKQLQTIKPLENKTNYELLYILEPVRDNWGHKNSGEIQALNYFVDCLPYINLPAGTLIKLRLHPSELPDKYDQWIRQHAYINPSIDTAANIAESLSRAAWVAGCESFGLILALMSGRKVYCTLPPYAHLCRLPYSNLIHLRELGINF